MAEVKKEAKEETKSAKSSDKVKVRNLTNKTLCLACGKIEPDKTGTATMAELSVYSRYIEKV